MISIATMTLRNDSKLLVKPDKDFGELNFFNPYADFKKILWLKLAFYKEKSCLPLLQKTEAKEFFKLGLLVAHFTKTQPGI